MMNISIHRELRTPVYIQIKNSIRKQILSGELTCGLRLPPERVLAKALGVHRNTVVKAYEALISEELVQSSVSPRGYFITYSSCDQFKRPSGFSSRKYPGALNFMLKEEYLRMDTLFNQLFYGEKSSACKNDIISMAADITSPKLYPRERLNQLLLEMTRDQTFDWFGFSPSQGLPQLISAISALLKDRHIHASSKEIQIVTETYEAIELTAKIFLSPHDIIIAEEPISPDMLQVFQTMGVSVITIPMDEDGMQTEYLEGLIVKYRPKLIYTIPTFHFPTSTVMPLTRRYQLLALSYKYDIPILEEDSDSMLRYDGTPVPSLKALDTVGNVIYFSSFIASICPGVRVGYMVSTEKITKKLSVLMDNTQIFVNPIGQYLAAAFIDRGDLYENVKRLCDFNRKNRDCICRELNRYPELGYEFTVPNGGTSLWCKLKTPVDPFKLLKTANRLGVSYMPGNLFFPFRSKGDEYLRLCYGNITLEEIPEGVRRLSEAIRIVRKEI